LQTLPLASAGLWAAAQASGSPEHASKHPAKVVVARREAALNPDGSPRAPETRKLLDKAVAALAGKPDAQAAWKSLFSPDDIIGIKVNCLAGRGLSSNPELVAALADSLALAGFERRKIIIWDRTERDLISAGFSTKGLNGARVLATDSAGVGYESSIEFSGAVGSCFSTIISRICTAIINVPVLKDHDLAGVSLGMKNFYGAIHNPNKYHDNNCDPYVADLSAHPFIRNKLRLVICDGLKAQYHGGPAPRPQWSWPAATLLVATDPVAVDRIGWDIIEEKRKEAGMKPLKDTGREPKYIKTADDLGLGAGDMAKITKISVS
jgi:uncharacterized protein (DUF362 family)